MIPYRLVRSERKTLGIYVLPGGKVEVRAPMRTAIGYINEFVEKKREWISRKIDELSKEKRVIAPDMQVFVFGTPYIIKIGKPGIENSTIFVREGLCREDAESLLGSLAKRILTERTKQISAETGLVPSSVKISKAKTRWGSCCPGGRININWRLIMGDAELADYVIVHELCHLRHNNHGREFWAEVQGILPGYKKTIEKLKAFQTRLTEEGWF